MDITSHDPHPADIHKLNTVQSPLIEIVRILRAPMDWIWKAWSDAHVIKQWWGPMGYISKHSKTDFRIGGKYLFDMVAPDGKIIWNTGVYEEIIPHKKIVFTQHFSDQDGNVVSGNEIGLKGNWAKKLYATITFENVEPDQIKMVVSHQGIPQEMFEECIEGWSTSLDKFQETVERYGDENLQPVKTHHH